MKKIRRIPVFALLFSAWLVLAGCAKEPPATTVREGDILFRITDTPQSSAIRPGTGSAYTHCGIALEKDGRLQVFEAAARVSWTPPEEWIRREWIRRGVRGHDVLMRLKDPSVLTPAVAGAMRADTAYFEGRDYDLLFQWSDDRIYCSELVWKLYKRNAGLELGPVRTFAAYDLNHEAVRKIIRERYGRDFRLDEKVVTPSDIMESNLLEVVSKNQGQPASGQAT